MSRVKHGGRKAGTPNKSNAEIREILDNVVDFNVVAAKLYELVKGVMVQTQTKKGEDVIYTEKPDSMAAKILMEYRFGKPAQHLVHETPDDKPFPVALIPQ